MSTLEHTPGPDAERAFRLGLLSAVIATASALAYLLWSGFLATHEVVLAAVAGTPVVLILASVLLSIWLGYDNRSLT